MNANSPTSAPIPAAGTSAPAAQGARTLDAGTTAQTPVPAAAGTKSPLAKWFLLAAGLCAAIVFVKAALLLSEILGIVNSVYDSSLT